jgi:hypothetical protein
MPSLAAISTLLICRSKKRRATCAARIGVVGGAMSGIARWYDLHI